jgi:hypothetical protein
VAPAGPGRRATGLGQGPEPVADGRTGRGRMALVACQPAAALWWGLPIPVAHLINPASAPSTGRAR